MTVEDLRARAVEASKLAYVPYSNVKIGAAIEDQRGLIFAGCNVENPSYSLSICAERNALFSGVAAGSSKFTRIYIFSEDAWAIPCGACRQVLSEFNLDMEVFVERGKRVEKFILRDLLPGPFILENKVKKI